MDGCQMHVRTALKRAQSTGYTHCPAVVVQNAKDAVCTNMHIYYHKYRYSQQSMEHAAKTSIS